MIEHDIEMLKNGDKNAFERIHEEYSPLIKSEVARVMSMAVGYEYDSDDLAQEAGLTLHKAALTYDPEKNTTFGLYAKICIRRRLVSYLRKLATAERRKEKERLSVAQTRHSAPEELMLEIEENSKLKKWLDASLTPLETNVLRLYLEKKHYSEIAKELGITEKSVDNAMYRVKRKIKEGYL